MESKEHQTYYNSPFISTEGTDMYVQDLWAMPVNMQHTTLLLQLTLLGLQLRLLGYGSIHSRVAHSLISSY